MFVHDQKRSVLVLRHRVIRTHAGEQSRVDAAIALEQVVSTLALQHVCGSVADNDVGQAVTDKLDRVRAGRLHVFDVRRQRIAHRSQYPVGSAARAGFFFHRHGF